MERGRSSEDLGRYKPSPICWQFGFLSSSDVLRSALFLFHIACKRVLVVGCCPPHTCCWSLQSSNGLTHQCPAQLNFGCSSPSIFLHKALSLSLVTMKLLYVSLLLSSAAALSVWPAPKASTNGSSVVWIAQNVQVSYNGANVRSTIENISYVNPL